jgi:endoglucanase
VISRLKTAVAALALATLLGVAAAPPGGAEGPVLRVQGNQIRDTSRGTEFIPRGVNWPSFEYACVQGWGYSNRGADAATAEAMLAWGINTVRIPLNQDCWLGDDRQPRNLLAGPRLTPAGYRQAVDSFVRALTGAGLAVIVDLHWSGPQGTVSDGLRPMPDNRSDDFWRSVATRFRDEPAVMFDVFNEPHSRWDPAARKWAFELDWDCWANGGCTAPDQPDTARRLDGSTYTTIGMRSLVGAVRSTGARQPVILGGLDYANDLSGWRAAAPADDQLVAAFHNYPGKPCATPACWAGEITALARHVPVLTTEVGQNDCRAGFTRRYMNWADRQGIGYLAWAWWDLGESLGAPGCTNFALIEDLDGTPTPGYGSVVRARLKAPLAKDPDPVLRVRPKLRIISARVKGGRLRARFRLDPLATGRLRIRQDAARLRRGRATRLRRSFRTTARVKAGRARVTMTVKKNWSAKRLFVTYRGNELVLPGKAARRVKGR